MDDFRPVETAPIFCLATEAQVLHTPEARAIDYFEWIYTQDVWQGLVADKNHYYDQHHHQCYPHPPTPHRPWEAVTVNLMKAFIGLT